MFKFVDSLVFAVTELPQRVDVVALDKLDEILVVHLDGDVTHEGNVFHKTTGLSFGGVRGTHESPLAGMDGSGTRNL